ncbi:septum site-determining protein MinC [Leucothrix arctica]|uniref:Probable septum site-determining protein MinC n=2 Tax=Leucothrix arctica TaxID=1481894 RepID=A0A317CDP8_9GAMM|nr:septum site-determining protein MinC [Leucothrix arctica]
MELKGEMSMLNVLHLQSTDLKEISQQIEAKRDEVPAFFLNSPVVVDCSSITDDLKKLDLKGLKACLTDLMFVPVGVRGIEPEQQAMVTKSGWPVLRAGPKKSTSKPSGKESSKPDESAKTDGDSEIQAQVSEEKATISRIIEKPVRSGQQVFVDEGDAVLLTHTSAGSEVMASGSVHVYGALRGRVLAGVHGDTNARIFCRSLDAELIAIAGRYQLLDEGDTDLRGKPAVIRLDGEKLIIEALE